jgi:1-aminocyclopropane-1-carboxylate deaminase/D-cysteine desulfhydrase-like pyridoxal-dependent ACC family enzyme
MERLTIAIGGPPLYVKRDDLCGFLFAGTKARTLQRLFDDALQGGYDRVVVGGGPASNLVPATAGAARMNRMACVAVLYGRPPPRGEEHPNLALTRWLGADVRFTGDANRSSVDAAILTVVDELTREGHRSYAIPRGGATPVGTIGSALAIAEVLPQLAELNVRPAAVVVATGSGGIHAGLLAGSVAAGMPWKVVGMSVSRPPEEVADRVEQLAVACAAELGWEPPPRSSVHLHDVRGEGYGIASPEGRAAATLAAHTEGLLLDPVYTAKAWAGLTPLVAEGVDGPVLVWHTGGTGGTLA